jgi:hypothetical protein
MSNDSARQVKSIKLAVCVAILAGFVSWAAAGPPHYLIIHAATFTGSSALNDLVAAKTGQGFQVTTKAIAAGTTKEAIKDYIQTFWNTPDAPDYIVLIGDSDTIPSWTGVASRHAMTDLYYVCMDGPSDWYPDIPIGRFALRTTSQLTAAVNKTLYVEAGNYADPSYITRVAFLATDDPGAAATTIHDAMISNYTAPAGLTPTCIYPIWPSGSGTPEITAAVNAGSLIVTYLGHSGSTGWWGPSFSQSNVNALTNLNKYGIVLGLSCDTADYTHSECFGETWLRKSQGGAAAFISSTNQIFYSTPEEWQSAHRLEEYFFRAAFEDGLYRIGPALQTALYYFLADPDYGPTHEFTRNYFEEFTILGDPALMLPIRGFQVAVDPPLQAVCSPPGQVQYTLQIDPHAGFDQAVTLAASGYPPGWNVTFSQNSLPPPFTTVMTVSNISGAAGLYDIALTATSAAGLHRYADAMLHLATAVPAAVVLSEPASGATGVPLSPALSWQVAARAAEYELQVARDSSFTNVVYSTTTELTSHRVDSYLDPLTNYFWRVRGLNGCGPGSYSGVRSFRTTAPPNYFTEQFSGVPLDIENYTYRFVPNGSADFYETCGEPATTLPTDPSGGYAAYLTEDGSEPIFPDYPVWLYGTSYAYFYVNANGNLTFNDGDSTAAETLPIHFSQPRIAPLFTDLSPQLGTASYKYLPDRFVVTFQNVPERGTSNLNTFQLELFYTSREIQITWLNCDAVGAIVGLSRGLGMPAGFFATDFSDYPCTVRGDLNCDGTINAFDIDPFVMALTNPTLYVSTYDCELLNGDINCDGQVNAFDIDPFVQCLTTGCPDCP